MCARTCVCEQETDQLNHLKNQHCNHMMFVVNKFNDFGVNCNHNSQWCTCVWVGIWEFKKDSSSRCFFNARALVLRGSFFQPSNFWTFCNVKRNSTVMRCLTWNPIISCRSASTCPSPLKTHLTGSISHLSTAESNGLSDGWRKCKWENVVYWYWVYWNH